MSHHNPFIYGKPVPLNRHINRHRELNLLFSRLQNGESTAIVGEPRIGKTSLLRYMKAPPILQERLGPQAERLVTVDLDFYQDWLSATRGPRDFWMCVLATIMQTVTFDIQREVTLVHERDYDSASLCNLFGVLGQRGWRTVLFIDEFEALLRHPSFATAVFLGGLRSLATSTDGLQLVTASIDSVADMNALTASYTPGGSEFLNYLAEARLKPFNVEFVADLLHQALAGGETDFAQDDLQFIVRLSGCHPYRVQVAGACLFDAIQENLHGFEKFAQAGRWYRELTADHFETVWRRGLDNSLRMAMVILALMELGGSTYGRSLCLDEAERPKQFDSELHRLERMGLIERVSGDLQANSENLMQWQGERWRVSAYGFVWWLVDAIWTGTRSYPIFADWLHEQELGGGLLTRRQWKTLCDWMALMPESALDIIGMSIQRPASRWPAASEKQAATQSATDTSSMPSPFSTTSPTSSRSSLDPGSVLIVTTTKTEAQAVLEVFSQAAGKRWTRQTIGNKTYYNLGVHGGASVFMAQSEMGTATPGGALLTVRQAIQDLRPQAVIMCGIAMGLRPDKQQLGDILIAKQLLYYEPQKVDLQRGQMPRGDRTTSSERLLDRFRSGDNDWQGAKTHFGLILSGEKLVNDPAFRDWLLKTEQEAIGGEMEGAGLYAAARDAKVDWILVKAICDWADGKKNDDIQQLAAQNAARFVLYVLRLGGWGGPE